MTKRGVWGLIKPGEKKDEMIPIFWKEERAVSAITDLNWDGALLQNGIYVTPTHDDRISGRWAFALE